VRMNIENFEQCLARLMKEYKISYSELTSILNYKSKNTLHRVVTGESGYKSRVKIFNDIISNDNLKFSKEDLEDLEQALLISKIGTGKFEAMEEMRNLLRRKEKTTEDIYITDIQTNKIISLDTFIDSLKNSVNDILIINCCWSAVSNSMTKLMDASPKTNITQYMVLTSKMAKTVSTIGNILPMVHYKGYMGYSSTTKDNGDPFPSALRYNLIAIRSKEENGKMSGYQIILHNENEGYITTEGYNLFDYWDEITKKEVDNMLQIKTSYPHSDTADEYLKFTEMYSKMEFNNAIYTYKPDICFNYINTQITKAAFIDGITGLGAGGLISEKLIKKLEEVHEKRYTNIFTKKKVTQHVCTAKGLKNFAETGILSDHFFAMRPYTLKERIEIFKNILDQEENNPHFNIHLLKDDNGFIEMEAICFENIGVDFTSMNTDYKLTEGHTEAIVRQKEFLELYIEYFTGELLRKDVRPSNETIAFLKQLIAQMEKSL